MSVCVCLRLAVVTSSQQFSLVTSCSVVCYPPARAVLLSVCAIARTLPSLWQLRGPSPPVGWERALTKSEISSLVAAAVLLLRDVPNVRQMVRGVLWRNCLRVILFRMIQTCFRGFAVFPRGHCDGSVMRVVVCG